MSSRGAGSGWIRVGWAIASVLGLAAASALLEHVLEARDAARLTADDTFVAVHGGRVRYRLTGTDKPGPTVVLLCGVAASLEQMSDVQAGLQGDLPVVSYDRGGMGFSDPAEGHDATAEAEELDGVLHAPGIAPPFVIVSYSGSASMAKVFTAAHRDIVKGLVFLDPTAPQAIETGSGGHGLSYWRKFGRLIAQTTVTSFFGYLRLKGTIARRHAPPPSRQQEKTETVLASFHHALATAHELLDLKRSDQEAAATPWFVETLPLGVLSTVDPEASTEYRYVAAGHRELAARSTRGIFRSGAHVDHGKILDDPEVVHMIVALVETVVNEAREPTGAGSPP